MAFRCFTGRTLSQPLKVTTTSGIKQKFNSQLDIKYLIELNYLYVSIVHGFRPVCSQNHAAVF